MSKPKINILFPCDFFNHKEVDVDYKEEYDAAVRYGFTPLIFCDDDFRNGKPLVLSIAAEHETQVIYRGWMMTVELYTRLYEEMTRFGYRLINSSKEYEFCHYFPDWYHAISKYTPKSIIINKDLIDKIDTDGMKSLIVKDYVKSRKHEWNDACFVPDTADCENLSRVVKNFIERQGDNFVGAVVLREFIALRNCGEHPKSKMPISKEVRVFVFNKRAFCYVDYWQGKETVIEKEIEQLLSYCGNIESNFYTIDFAEKENGGWIIMEIGDGQVSGLQDYSADCFYESLSKEIMRK